MKSMLPALLSVVGLVFAGCQGNDLGTGANTVDREFSKPAHDVWKASVKSAEASDLKISSDVHDELGGELVACRGNGDEVRILVKSLDERRSQVSVRVEPGDRPLAALLQERIAEKLGLGEAKAGLLGGNSQEGIYASDLSHSMLQARGALRSLQVTLTDEESHATWARIDGRLKDSTPVRIKMEQIDDLKTRVTFIAGNEKTQDNKAFAQRMKEEYEIMTQPKGSHSD